MIGQAGAVQPPPTPEQGGPLLVTRVGATAVATDGMQAHLEQLSALHDELAVVVRMLVVAESPPPPLLVGATSAARAQSHLDSARHSTRAAHRTAEQLLHALRQAIIAYDAAENEALQRLDRLAALGGAGLGEFARAALPVLMLLGAAAWLVSKAPDPGGARAAAVRHFFLEHPELVTGPVAVEGVRMFTQGLDEGMSTLAGIPLPTAVMLGAAGATGVRTSARELLVVGPLLGAFRETPVRVERLTTSSITTPAVGAVQRLERVPEVDQVRIEKYDAPGLPSRFVVYLGPTETFSPIADHEPWDLTSNVGGVGGLDVGAYRASELAMRDAGITENSPVQFVGFSQGGLVATMLAGSGDWNASGIQTFGAPAGNIQLPEGLHGMAVRNTDDLVPMLAGPQLDHQLLQVERRAFSAGEPLPTYHAAPAHQRDAYAATAEVIDAAGSAAVRDQSAALDAFTGDYVTRPGSTITVIRYHAERLPEGATPALREVTNEAR